MNPFTLYSLSAEYTQVMRDIEDADGVLTPELEARLDAATAALATGAANVKMALEMIDHGKDQLDAWIRKLSTRKAALEREEQRWKDAAIRNMSGMGINTLEGELNGLPAKLRVMESESVKITGDVPAAYSRTKTIVEPDKKMIKEALKEGADVPGAILERNTFLRVY